MILRGPNLASYSAFTQSTMTGYSVTCQPFGSSIGRQPPLSLSLRGKSNRRSFVSRSSATDEAPDLSGRNLQAITQGEHKSDAVVLASN